MSSFVTIVVVPLLLLIFRSLAKHLKNWTSYLIDGLMYWASRAVLHSLAARLSLRKYARIQLQGDNQYLYVPSKKDIKLPVDQIFVTLQLEHHGGTRETYTHQDLLALSSRLRVMGDPGSGKTSLAKRIFRDECRAAISHPTKSRLPIYIELKTVNIPPSIREKALGRWLLEHLRSLVAAVSVYKMKECFEACLKTGGLLILLDGLDEVSKGQYPRVCRAVEQLSELLQGESEKAIVLLTMRTQFYQQIKDDFRESGGQALFIRPFKPTDIFEFLTRWPSANAATHDWLTQIYKDLTDRPTLREMCSNPLVLAMYVAEYESSNSPLAPESRTEFYKRVTEELLIKRRLKQIGKTPAASKLREQRERILGRIAYEHLLDLRQPSNSLRWGDAIRTVKGIMRCSSDCAETLFREIAKETGLVSEERPRETLRFIHLTFCEFLAAYEAMQGQKDGWGSLMRANTELQRQQSPQTHARLIEVIPFAAGLATRIRQNDIMTELAATGDYRLMARSFLETKNYEHETWQAFAEGTKRLLLGTPESEWNEEWLRDLHLFNVVVRDQQQCASFTQPHGIDIDLSEFYRTLVSKQQNSLAALLRSYAAQDAAAAFRLAEICGLDLLADYPEIVSANMDQNLFFELVLQNALGDDSRLAKSSAVIVEAALRSPPVAAKLSKLPPDARVGKHVASVPRRKRWTGRGLDSLYGQLVTVALSQPSRPYCAALGILRGLPPCGNLVRLSEISAGSVLILSYVITMAAIMATPHGRPIWFRLGDIAAMTVWMTLSFEVAIMLRRRPMFYRLALNLVDRGRAAAPDPPTFRAFVASRLVPRFGLFGFGLSKAQRQTLRQLELLRGMEINKT